MKIIENAQAESIQQLQIASFKYVHSLVVMWMVLPDVSAQKAGSLEEC
jgi:hypothetical protein